MKDKTIILDLTGCPHVGELHLRIQKAFGFPEWYGKNWSAFHDLLSTECIANKIIVVGEKTLSSQFERDIKLLHKILEDEKIDRKKHNWMFEVEYR